MDQNIFESETFEQAYIIRGGGQACSTLEESFEKKGIKTKGNPDFYIKQTDTLSVDDARDISQFAALSPVGEKKYICIVANSMTGEAQNALLKVVEEAVGKSAFFFVIPSGTPVLGTLLSRCIEIKDSGVEGDTKEGEQFLKMDYKERLNLAEGFQKNHDRDGARSLVRSLLYVAQKKKFSKEVLGDLLQADEYLKLSGSSPKGVIGHLALVL